MSLSAQTQTHTQIKSRFPHDANVITSLESSGRRKVLPAFKLPLPCSLASIALPGKAKARTKSLVL